MDESTTNNGDSDQSSSDSLSNDESLLDENQNTLADESDQVTASSEENSQDADQSSGQSQDEQSETTDEEDGSSEADGLAKFAKSQGIEDFDGLSDREKKLLKVAHDNQKAFHKKSQERSDELRQATDEVHTPDEESDEDPRDVEIAQIRANQRVTDFYMRNQDAVDYDKEMSDIVKAEAEKNGVQAARYLASNLDNLLILAKAKRGGTAEMAREAGRKEERELLRKKQAASADSGQAQSTNRSSKKISRSDILAMPDEDYAKLRESGELDEMIARGDLY